MEFIILPNDLFEAFFINRFVKISVLWLIFLSFYLYLCLPFLSFILLPRDPTSYLLSLFPFLFSFTPFSLSFSCPLSPFSIPSILSLCLPLRLRISSYYFVDVVFMLWRGFKLLLWAQNKMCVLQHTSFFF